MKIFSVFSPLRNIAYRRERDRDRETKMGDNFFA